MPTQIEKPHSAPAFFRSLRNFINKSTVLGIDANCVPDVQLDVKNHSRSPYNNLGVTWERMNYKT